MELRGPHANIAQKKQDWKEALERLIWDESKEKEHETKMGKLWEENKKPYGWQERWERIKECMW